MSKFPMKLASFLFENLFGKAGCPIPPGFDLQREKTGQMMTRFPTNPAVGHLKLVVKSKGDPESCPEKFRFGNSREFCPGITVVRFNHFSGIQG